MEPKLSLWSWAHPAWKVEELQETRCLSSCTIIHPIFHLCLGTLDMALFIPLSSLAWGESGSKQQLLRPEWSTDRPPNGTEQMVLLSQKYNFQATKFVLTQMSREWWFMNEELAGVLENSWVGRRDSEDTAVSWSDAVNTADTLAGPLVSQPLYIFTGCEYSQITSSVGVGQVDLHTLQMSVFGTSVYAMEWHMGKVFILFLSEWFICNKFRAQCLLLPP